MQYIEQSKRVDKLPVVATIGFFDGVHKGHRFLINQVNKIAIERGLPSAVITFTTHPRKVLQPDYNLGLLCSYDEKIIRIAATKIDYCMSMDFTEELSRMTAREYIHKILSEKFCVKVLVVGYDHRFGHNREEGFEEYKKYGSEVGMEVIEAQEYPDEHISASRIRTLLSEGDVKNASTLLSYNYLLSGKIIEGYKVGRTIGFPTANVQAWEHYKVIPAFGVYAVNVYLEGEIYGGMLYIGRRPTLQNGTDISVEVNIFGFDGDLYNKSLSTEFLEFVRQDEKFSDMDSLRNQLFKDKEDVLKILEEY